VRELVEQAQRHIARGARRAELRAEQASEQNTREHDDWQRELDAVDGDVVVGRLVVRLVDALAEPVDVPVKELRMDEVLLRDPEGGAERERCSACSSGVNADSSDSMLAKRGGGNSDCARPLSWCQRAQHGCCDLHCMIQ
jgi:hypothetical protein